MDSTALSNWRERYHQRPRSMPTDDMQDADSMEDRIKLAKRTATWMRMVLATGIVLVFIVTMMRAGSEWDTIRRQQEKVSFSRDIAKTDLELLLELDILSLGARNEYGEYDHHATALYGLELVVEPYRETVLHVVGANERASFHWSLVQVQEEGGGFHVVEDADPIINAMGGPHATVELREPGQLYVLEVKQFGAYGKMTALGRTKVSCKYVRRELRALTARDRTAFFEAMRTVYTTSWEEEKQEYGEGFINYAGLTAHHNAREFCFHNGMQFLLAHTAFNAVLEQSLQAVNPRVSLASWDFMIDAAELGADWPSSEIFGSDMFGSAMGDAEKSFQISDGWFANISTIYDPDDTVAPSWLRVDHNAYGYVSAKHNYQDLPVVTRTHSYCGMRGHAPFAKCPMFIQCFETNNNMNDWETCMENEVDMEKFLEAHPGYTRGLLTFAMEFILANAWPSNRLFSDLNSCDSECTTAQTEPCGCTCDIDVETLSDDEVYSYMEKPLRVLTGRFSSDLYIDNDPSMTYSIGFKQDGVRLSEDMNAGLRRVMMKVGCEPGAIGAMSGGASPSDPIFWVLHPIYEKALHALLLAPRYRDSYDFTWVDRSCTGSSYLDKIPFTERVMGLGNGTEMLTNAQLMDLLSPYTGKITYMYDSFRQWGDCVDWDPCPECNDESFNQVRYRDKGSSEATIVQVSGGFERHGKV